jgi:hypothetical protein
MTMPRKKFEVEKKHEGAPSKPSFGLGGVVDLASVLVPVLVFKGVILSEAKDPSAAPDCRITQEAFPPTNPRRAGAPFLLSFGRSGVVDRDVAGCERRVAHICQLLANVGNINVSSWGSAFV